MPRNARLDMPGLLQHVKVRGIVCYLAVRDQGYKGNEASKAIFLTASGISIAVRRGECFINKNKGVKQDMLSKIEK
jgi:hypothetical protein